MSTGAPSAMEDQSISKGGGGFGTSRPRPQVNATFLLAVLEPAAAFLLPYRFLVKFVKMCIQIVQRVLFHFDGLDLLRLYLVHHLYRVFNRRLNRWQEC